MITYCMYSLKQADNANAYIEILDRLNAANQYSAEYLSLIHFFKSVLQPSVVQGNRSRVQCAAETQMEAYGCPRRAHPRRRPRPDGRAGQQEGAQAIRAFCPTNPSLCFDQNALPRAAPPPVSHPLHLLIRKL
ncbi:MAG: hypothetical protein MZU95_08310 [Desulfomicrobium escambiense]|nr:hypothetical protein [Desulfomicrobium escambiense]